MKHDRQKKAYDFLQSRVSGTFQMKELAVAADWEESSAGTYISKYLKGLVEKLPRSSNFRVRREFRRLTFEQYKRLADQTRRVFQTYDRDEYGALVTFEFLLPLTQESKLTRALDDIFYSDTIVAVLLESGPARFEKWVARPHGHADQQYAEHLAKRADMFGGYSIQHVAGRFRANDLMTRREAGKLFEKDRPYLMDETTASVRFIVPLARSKVRKGGPEQLLLQPVVEPMPTETADIADEIEFIRTLFFCLFVEALIRNITGEDQIWLIEESPLGRRLHVWKPED